MKIIHFSLISTYFMLVAQAVALNVHGDTNCTDENIGSRFLGKRGLCRNLSCFLGKDRSGTYSPHKPNRDKETKGIELLRVTSEVTEDKLSAGETIAFENMRERLLTILRNLNLLEKTVRDPDDLEASDIAERLAILRSAADSLHRSQGSYETYSEEDWEWFFGLSLKNDSTLRKHHRHNYERRFEQVRKSIQRCAKHFGILGLDVD
ncbi:hypothetical protein METSCH_A02030 [Metschnikowia aff. pulcherrima]|uniref:Uncharacterized protein n=1 Tax=Metschnikowia aff. pulcherrima TaxID=2163413 RepID=A0A4P6XIV9_9ASCO|nr:hypothetical protein METSCH_A02030 [Metschnikowia aff. pulcherrima]